MKTCLILLCSTLWLCFLGVFGQQVTADVELVVKERQQKIDVLVDGDLFTSYMYQEGLKKPILWPLISAGGNVLTRTYPMEEKTGERVDHPHHVGIWLNYGRVNGLDFWNNSTKVPAEKKDRYGTIYHRSIDKVENGNGKINLVTTSDWKSADGTLILTESTTFEFNVQEDIRYIDRTTTLTAVVPEVLFADNKEGMFAIRVTRELELPVNKPIKVVGLDGKPVEKISNEGVTGNYRSATGIEGKQVWGSRARWMKLFGEINEEKESIIIIDHPSNPGYPTYWHAREYGLFSANTLGQKIFSKGEHELNLKLKSGESVTFRYRLVSATGAISDERINQMTDQFAAR